MKVEGLLRWGYFLRRGRAAGQILDLIGVYSSGSEEGEEGSSSPQYGIKSKGVLPQSRPLQLEKLGSFSKLNEDTMLTILAMLDHHLPLKLVSKEFNEIVSNKRFEFNLSLYASLRENSAAKIMGIIKLTNHHTLMIFWRGRSEIY